MDQQRNVRCVTSVGNASRQRIICDAIWQSIPQPSRLSAQSVVVASSARITYKSMSAVLTGRPLKNKTICNNLYVFYDYF